MSTERLLDGDVAFVTGAGRNIGAGIAERFAEHGASVVVNDVDEERATGVVEELPADGDRSHRALVGDMTDAEAVADAAATVADEHGGVDVLVNNLGYAVNKDVFETSLEEWHRVLDLTLTSTFLCTKHFGEQLIEREGAVVNLASRLARFGSTDKVAYCAAKGGVVNMTRQLALDFAEHDVRVNAISPGNVGDPVGRTSGRGPGFDTNHIPLDRVGDPGDVADAALFLASDLADYVTGADLAVDGGTGA